MRDYLSPFLVGFGFVTSMIAISNLIHLEHIHGKILSEGNFQVFLKFLSAKILVSLVFSMSLLFEFLTWFEMGHFYTDMEQNLLRAAVLNTLCLGVAGIAHKAWTPDAAWYQGMSILEIEKR